MNEYLKNTIFRTKDISKIIREYLGNMRIVILLMIALLVGGYISFRSLPQTVAPEINLSIIVVSTGLPGATPENVESLVTIPIEKELKSISGIDTVVSVAENSYTYSVLTFKRGVDQDRALSDTENAVNRVTGLPDDVTPTNVKAVDFEDSPVLRVAFSMKNDSQASLAGHINKLIDNLESNQLIDRVTSAGQVKQEIQIVIEPEEMSSLGLNVLVIQEAVKNAITALPSGTIEDVEISRSLTMDASVNSLQDLRSLTISLGNKQYALQDIATITVQPSPGQMRAWKSEKGEETKAVVVLDVFRTSGVDLNKAAQAAESIINQAIADSNGVMEKTVLLSISDQLSTQFNDLMHNLRITIGLVFITLMLFVGWRQAFLAALSIPLTYSVALIVMYAMGISINFLSLFSLLLSLGLLVDVTIVVVSAMTSYMREGRFSAYKTGLLVYRDFFTTLLITTLTTIWAFIPLLLSGGIMGEYLRPIPIIVSSILLSSVLIGIFIILPLMIWLFDFSLPKRVRVLLGGIIVVGLALAMVFGFGLPKIFIPIALLLIAVEFLIAKYIIQKFFRKNKNKKNDTINRKREYTFIDVSKLERYYKTLLQKILFSKKARWRTIAIVIIFSIFSFSLVGTGFVKNEFFPGQDNDFLFASVELAEGTKAVITEKVAKEVAQKFAELGGVSAVTVQVGFGINQNMEINGSSSNKAVLTILTPKEDKGSREVARLARQLPVVIDNKIAKVALVEVSGGPPAGADVVVTFKGENLGVLRSLAQELKSRINKSQESAELVPNKTAGVAVENILISPHLTAATVSFVPDELLLAERGISRATVAGQLRLFASGFTLAEDVEFDDLNDQHDIVLRFSNKSPTLTELGQLMIDTAQGAVPLESLGELRLTQNISQIKREDFDRTVTLTATLVGKANLVDVNKQIAEIIDNEIELPAGYSWSSGGANEENNKSVKSILQGMLLAFVLIFLTLIVHLKSYRKAFIVLLTIPLAASGVFVMFAVLGISLSFPALIGVLALFGIVVNNAIIVVSQINANRKVGMAYQQSIIEGASSRLEPILLSSATTIIGLLPITLSDPVWRGLGGAIISGLLFSGTIMLFFIPVVYYLMMGDEE